MKIKFNPLYDNVNIPEKSTAGSACYDVVATSINYTDDYVEYGLGFATEIPKNFKGQIFPRSSVSKKDLLMCNSPGQIDCDYRGEWKVRFKRTKATLIRFVKEQMKTMESLLEDLIQEYEEIPWYKFRERYRINSHINRTGTIKDLITLMFTELVQEEKIYKVGDRVAQIEFCSSGNNVEYNICEALSSSDRGEGGFGSTGN